MALADRGWRRGCFLPLADTLPVTARLLATVLLALFTGPIPPSRQPPRPNPRRLGAGFATVPRERMRGRKPPLATLQQTNPRPSLDGDLRLRRRVIMLDRDQGSANSRRSSLGVEIPLHSGTLLTRHLLLIYPRSSLITPLPLFHPFLRPPATWPPFPRESSARGLAP
jgi:hypothetical protein